MSELEKGDRVKVTVEAVVYDTNNGRFLSLMAEDGRYLGALYIDDYEGCTCTVEKIPDPLPTTPGSVVIDQKHGTAFRLATDGKWYSSYGAATHNPSQRSAAWRERVEVIHDARKVA